MPSYSQGTYDLAKESIQSSATSSTSLPSFSTASSATDLSRQSVETWLERINTAGAKRKRCLSEEAENASDTLIQIEPTTKNLEAMAGQSTPNRLQMPSPAMTLSSDGPPQTPNNRQGSSSQSVVSHTSRSTHSSNISAPKQELWISERLTVHGLLQDDDALDRHTAFQKTVRDNVFSQRDSALRPQSAQHIIANLKLYRNDEEDTFLGMVLPTLINDTHLERAKQDLQDATFSMATEVQDRVVDVKNLQDGETYIAQYWRQDGVVVGINKNLHKDLLPYAYPDPDLDKMLKKDRHDTMTTPRPDRIYGLSTCTLPIPSGLDKDAHILLRVCSNQQHPFFIFEGKSNQGNTLGAQNQARRGGAELVYSARLLRTKLNMPEVSQGPDLHTYVYSCTITPDFLALWVHWAEVTPQKTLYHMSRLKSFLLYDDKESFAQIRLALHNILGWGCDLEARGLLKLHERLCEWQKGCNSAVGKTTDLPRKKKRPRTSGGEETGEGLDGPENR